MAALQFTRANADLPFDNSGLLEGRESAVLVDRLETARGYAHTNEFLKLRHPDAMLVQIWAEDTRHILGYVTTDAALFLGHTATPNSAAACRT